MQKQRYINYLLYNRTKTQFCPRAYIKMFRFGNVPRKIAFGNISQLEKPISTTAKSIRVSSSSLSRSLRCVVHKEHIIHKPPQIHNGTQYIT